MHDPSMYPSGKANQDTAAGQTRLGSHVRYHRTVPSPCHHRCHGNATGERWRGGTVQMGGLNRHPLKRMARAQPRFDLGGLGSGGTGCANIYIHIYERERERERERRRTTTTTTTAAAAATRGGGGRGGDSERTKTKTIATKRPKKIHQWQLRSRVARPRPRPEPAANPAPTVPNPNPRRRSTVGRPKACNPTRRGGAGRGVAPGGMDPRRLPLGNRAGANRGALPHRRRFLPKGRG